MARDYSKTNFGLWQDADWRSLPWPAQHVYKMFWEHPGLSYCGVVDWRPLKMLGWGQGWDKDFFLEVTDCLRARYFLVVDEETEECLVRSWVRWDGLMKQPRLATSFTKAYAEAGSVTLRGVVVDEMKKLHEREPDLAGWAKPDVQQMFAEPAIEAKSLPVPEDPYGSGFAWPTGHVSEAFGGNTGSRFGSRTTASTTSSSNTSSRVPDETADAEPPNSGRKRPGKRIPKDWQPNDKHRAYCLERGIDCEQQADNFRAHAEANDRRLVIWDAGFRQWLGNSKPDPRALQPAPYRPRPHELVKPPDGLTDAQYDEFLKDPQGFVDRWSA